MTIAELYEEFEVRLRRYAISLVQDSDRADDLVQETLIRAMAHLELLEQLNPHQRRAWLYRVLKNRFIDEHRAHQREQVLAEQLAREAQYIVSYHSPYAAWSDILGLVPEQYRDVLHQRYVLGMTSTEIGEELGVPPATVRSRLHLAIKWLRGHTSKFL
jgi:RNA polymerase sigma-70 factor (ECF subfamily)